LSSLFIAFGPIVPTLAISDGYKNLIFKKVHSPMILEDNSYYSLEMYALLQTPPDRESEENEPITDLPIVDSPCQSSCPPNYKMCIYICN
jgi:hypothetical protein